MLPNVLPAFFKIFFCEFSVGCGWNLVALHEFFGKSLTAFQLRAVCGWTNNNPTPTSPGGGGFDIIIQIIVNAVYQWVFRPYNHELNIVFGCKIFNRFK